MRAYCPNCLVQFDLGTRVGGKVGGAVAGAIAGGATKHPTAVIVGAILGGLAGHWFDTEVLPRCPSCGVALRAVDLLT